MYIYMYICIYIGEFEKPAEPPLSDLKTFECPSSELEVQSP